MSERLTASSPTVSVIVVSRDRPEALQRCLLAVSQLMYDPFEVVVVTDPQSFAVLQSHQLADKIKLLSFDDENISAARNHGIHAAAGEIIAFLDDDAVPEPTWLVALVAPFSRADVVASGGFVRGRNGISWQSTAQAVDRMGRSAPLDIACDKTTVLSPGKNRGIKTQGTNMAVRRSVLARLGGFDPRYRFFLDETDLNLRLAESGGKTAFVPRAQVHHGYQASRRRRSDRVPLDLTEIGASWAVFLNSHCPKTLHRDRWREIKRAERARALYHLVRGGLEPRDVRRLMASLQNGYSQGLSRPALTLPPVPDPTEAFLPFPSRRDTQAILLSGRSWSRSRLHQQAIDLVKSGKVATVLRFSPTAVFHRVRFTQDGYWEQTGGLFGRSRRSDPLFSLWRFSSRVRAETDRIARVRGLWSDP
ncbi:glycosyltransferase family 2 protein [Primorskyibacter sp. S87]|uniref:glycosyltransferase family 2 protein n=1 Tax=Primorskyibacter sp. S87 TaxID=3415126 RepID=UPI003C7CA5B8